MAVRQRGKGWQGDFRWEGQRVRDTKPTKEEAEKWIETTRTDLTQGRAVLVNGRLVYKTQDVAGEEVDDTHFTIDNLVQYTYDLHWAGTKNAKFALANARDVAKVIGGYKHPSKIDSRAVLDLIANLKARGNSNGTINRKLSAISTLLDYGKQRGVVRNPPDIKWQREGKGRVRFYSREEEARIIDWFQKAEQRSMADLTQFLADTGCRLTEGLTMTFRDWDQGAEEIRFWGSLARTEQTTKNGRSRSVGTTIRVQEVLTRRKAAAPAGEARVFWDLNRHKAENWWVKMREGIGMEADADFVLHTLRHTFASRLAMAGADLLDIQKLGGWETLSMVTRYAHLLPAKYKAAVIKLNDPSIG